MPNAAGGNGSGVIGLLLGLLPVVTALLGAFVGYWLRGFESRKSEVMARIGEAIEEVGQIEEVACGYWARDSEETPARADDLRCEGEILGRLHSLSLMIEDLAPHLDPTGIAEIGRRLRELRQQATGQDFAASNGHRARSGAISGCFRASGHLKSQFRRAGRQFNAQIFYFRKSA
jgi:hypothetical protein